MAGSKLRIVWSRKQHKWVAIYWGSEIIVSNVASLMTKREFEKAVREHVRVLEQENVG